MPFCCAGHIEIPDMGRDCPVEIVFDDSTKCGEHKMTPGKNPYSSFDTQTSYVFCECKKYNLHSIYNLYTRRFHGSGYSFSIELPGKEIEGVRWERPNYQWVRIEKTKAAAALLNQAYEYSLFVYERNYRNYHGNTGVLKSKNGKVIGKVEIGTNPLPLLLRAGEDFTFQYLGREPIQYNTKNLTYNEDGPGGWHNNEHYPRHLTHAELTKEFLRYKPLHELFRVTKLPSINENKEKK
jgi:hypothetical protein